MFRAARTGVQLAEAISRTTGQKFTLVGHSLGARVIYYALEALSTKDTLFVDNVILLGGAIGRKDKEGWERAANAVSGKIYNCFSKQDKILRLLQNPPKSPTAEHVIRERCDFLNPCGGVLQEPQILNLKCLLPRQSSRGGARAASSATASPRRARRWGRRRGTFSRPSRSAR